MKGIALWFLGIPLPIILILYLFNVLCSFLRSAYQN